MRGAWVGMCVCGGGGWKRVHETNSTIGGIGKGVGRVAGGFSRRERNGEWLGVMRLHAYIYRCICTYTHPRMNNTHTHTYGTNKQNNMQIHTCKQIHSSIHIDPHTHVNTYMSHNILQVTAPSRVEYGAYYIIVPHNISCYRNFL